MHEVYLSRSSKKVVGLGNMVIKELTDDCLLKDLTVRIDSRRRAAKGLKSAKQRKRWWIWAVRLKYDSKDRASQSRSDSVH